MDKTQKMNEKIMELRQELQELIKEKDDLLDPGVVVASQELDKALNEYTNLIKQLEK